MPNSPGLPPGGDTPYRSDQRSVINNAGADRVGRHGDPLKSNPNAVIDRNNTNTDKYYAESKRQGVNVDDVTGVPQGSSIQPVDHAQNVNPIPFDDESDVHKVRGRVVQRLEAGAVEVIIQVGGDDPSRLQRALRTQLDLCVSRKQITAAQYKTVYFSGLQLEPPNPDQVALAEEEDDIAPDDMDAFVKRTSPEDAQKITTKTLPDMPAGLSFEEEQAAIQQEQEMLDSGLEATVPVEATVSPDEDDTDDDDDDEVDPVTSDDDTDDDDDDDDDDGDGDSGEDAPDDAAPSDEASTPPSPNEPDEGDAEQPDEEDVPDDSSLGNAKGEKGPGGMPPAPLAKDEESSEETEEEFFADPDDDEDDVDDE